MNSFEKCTCNQNIKLGMTIKQLKNIKSGIQKDIDIPLNNNFEKYFKVENIITKNGITITPLFYAIFEKDKLIEYDFNYTANSTNKSDYLINKIKSILKEYHPCISKWKMKDTEFIELDGQQEYKFKLKNTGNFTTISFSEKLIK